MKSFSIIIPTLNEENYILNILQDIYSQNIVPNEIIVVDGYSKDNTKKIIIKKYPNVNILSCPPNVSSQRNYGAKNASGKILFFLDADTKLPRNFFKKALSKINNKNKIICPYYLPYNSNVLIFSIYIFFNSMFFLFQKISASGAGSCIIIKKDLFNRLNGFSIHTKFEDIELIRKASKATNFSLINSYIWVSDRRFRKYGVVRTTIQYLLLSFLFMFNQFNISAGFNYQFGKYESKS